MFQGIPHQAKFLR